MPPQVVLAAAAKLILSLRNCLPYLQTCKRLSCRCNLDVCSFKSLSAAATVHLRQRHHSAQLSAICDAVTAGDSAQHRKGQLCGGKAGNPVCSERHGAVRSGSNPLALCDGVKRSSALRACFSHVGDPLESMMGAAYLLFLPPALPFVPLPAIVPGQTLTSQIRLFALFPPGRAIRPGLPGS